MTEPHLQQGKGPAEVSRCELTILMPCLNEAATIRRCVRKAMSFLQASGVDGEVLIADNGSSDGSQEIAVREGARVINVERRGYGAALLGGIRAARGEYVIMGDADDSYDFSALGPFVERLRAGDELVMGNRFRGGIEPGAMPFLHRYLGNPVLSGLGRMMFGGSIRDFHCGLRGFRRASMLRVAPATEGMEFASEMIVRAVLNNLKISEVPATLSVDGRDRAPHLQTWRDGWRHLRFLLAFSPRWLFLVPGMTLFVVGLAAMLWLIPGPQRIGSVNFDTTTLLYASGALVLGAQVTLFAVLSKFFAIRAGLHPPHEGLERFLRVVTLERSLIISLLLIVVGVLGSMYAFWYWGSRSFGALDYSKILRIAIPSMTAMALGGDGFFGMFVLWLLGLGNGSANEE